MADHDAFNIKLSAADQVLAFTLAWFCTSRTSKPAERKMMADTLQKALPYVTSNHPVLDALAAAAVDVALFLDDDGRPWPVDRGRGYWRAHYDASQAVTSFAMWRAGRASESFERILEDQS